MPLPPPLSPPPPCLYSSCVSYVTEGRIQLLPVLLHGCCFSAIIYLSAKQLAATQRSILVLYSARSRFACIHAARHLLTHRTQVHKLAQCPCELALFTCKYNTDVCGIYYARACEGITFCTKLKRNTDMRVQMCSTAVIQMCSRLDRQGWGNLASRPVQLQPPIIIRHSTQPDAV